MRPPLHPKCHSFTGIWALDFEYRAAPGQHPSPICLVAWNLMSGEQQVLWEEDLRRARSAPYPTGTNSLFVAYYSSAEWNCHLALGWPLPERVLDLYVEFRCIANGKTPLAGWGLLGALTHFGLDPMSAIEKQELRALALREGPWTAGEKRALLDYCESDVRSLALLLPKMLPLMDLPRALLRGRYMVALARVEANGVPVDVRRLRRLRRHWDSIKHQLIDRIDSNYHVFDGTTFKAKLWAEWLEANRIPWPTLPSGALALDKDTFKSVALAYPGVAPIHELRASLSQVRLSALAVGPDGRNRTMLSAFGARTSRNTPSNTKFIFGAPAWMRALIRPDEGTGLAYVDWSQQEFGIAAALSGDKKMIGAYLSGDPYLSFAKQAGAVPEGATKESHGQQRELFKACALAVQYGMEARSLGSRIGQPPAHARDLLEAHRRTYRQFWKWSDGAVDHAMILGTLHTVFGWTIHVDRDKANTRSLRNFPMQANGAEMLRLACCLATEWGIRVCAPVHDALLIEAPLDELQEAVELTWAAMAEASKVVLDGFELRSDVKLIRHPQRYMDERGREMWRTVWQIIREHERETRSRVVTSTRPPVTPNPSTSAPPSNLIYVSSGGVYNE